MELPPDECDSAERPDGRPGNRPLIWPCVVSAAVLALSACAGGTAGAPRTAASRTPSRPPVATNALLSTRLDEGGGYTVRIPAGWKPGDDNGGADKDVYLVPQCAVSGSDEQIIAEGPLSTAAGSGVKSLKDFTDKLIAQQKKSLPARLTTPPHAAPVSLGGSPTLEYTLNGRWIHLTTFRGGAGYHLMLAQQTCPPNIDAVLNAVASSWHWTQ